jgi:hypothetical protein
MIRRKQKTITLEKTHSWDYESPNYAHAEAFVAHDQDETRSIHLQIGSQWVWAKEDIEDLKYFLDTLLEEAF